MLYLLFNGANQLIGHVTIDAPSHKDSDDEQAIQTNYINQMRLIIDSATVDGFLRHASLIECRPDEDVVRSVATKIRTNSMGRSTWEIGFNKASGPNQDFGSTFSTYEAQEKHPDYIAPISL